jgi:hypothetical protein
MRVMKFVNKNTGEIICRICGQPNVITRVSYPSGLRFPTGAFCCPSQTCIGRRRYGFRRRGANRMPWDDQRLMPDVKP